VTKRERVRERKKKERREERGKYCKVEGLEDLIK
jgi:hypothetical protein